MSISYISPNISISPSTPPPPPSLLLSASVSSAHTITIFLSLSLSLSLSFFVVSLEASTNGEAAAAAAPSPPAPPPPLPPPYVAALSLPPPPANVAPTSDSSLSLSNAVPAAFSSVPAAPRSVRASRGQCCIPRCSPSLLPFGANLGSGPDFESGECFRGLALTGSRAAFGCCCCCCCVLGSRVPRFDFSLAGFCCLLRASTLGQVTEGEDAAVHHQTFSGYHESFW